MECKHKWKPVSEGGGFYRDECSLCGAVGYMDFKEGIIKAKPLAKVIDFAQFKKTREIKYVEGKRIKIG